MRRFTRKAIVAIAAALLASIPLTAKAVETTPPPPPVTQASAAAYTVSPGSSINVNVRKVILPGMKVQMSISLGNYSATPSQAQIKFKIRCTTKDFRFLTVYGKTQIVTVPGDPANPPKGGKDLKSVSDEIEVPAECASQKDSGPITHDGSFVAEMGPVGAEYIGVKDAFFHVGLPFTVTYFRENLVLQDGLVAESQAHHTLPQKFEGNFGLAGINIHDPIYLRWWCSRAGVPGNHSSKAFEYNQLWETFFRTNPNATAAQILAYRASIQGRYVYTCPKP
ncbi:hypothetical protein OG394_16190 [Kribbella sp. NBC_01245]|uniref:hypothetical protein n=1 Tax=Kribbella sp. NBC_01245 TaxID=2903578 RepID=UPI002E2863CC|nr:hypothetical protein [Kribbella sp. NBC_01245]